MFFYYCIYGLIPIIYFMSFIFFRYKKIVFFLLTNLLLIFVISLRGISVGSDTTTYYSISNWVNVSNDNILSLSKNSGIEPLYLAFNRLINIVSNNTQSIVPLVSLLTVLFFSILIYAFSEDYLTSYVVYVGFCYYFLSFNISRQFFAIGICWLAVFCQLKNKDKLSLVLILVAFFIHRSALLFIILWFLIKFKVSRKNLKFVIVGSIVAFAVGYKFLLTYLQGIPRYSDFFNFPDQTHGFFQIFFVIVIDILFVFIYLKKSKDDNEVNLINFYLYTFFLICFFDNLSLFIVLFDRVKYVFEPLLILIIPHFINTFFNKKEKILVVVILFILGIIFMSVVIPNNDFYGIIPYKFNNNF